MFAKGISQKQSNLGFAPLDFINANTPVPDKNINLTLANQQNSMFQFYKSEYKLNKQKKTDFLSDSTIYTGTETNVNVDVLSA